MFLYSGVSTYAARVDGIILFIITVSSIILAGLTAFVIYCLLRYNRKKHPIAANISGNLFLETSWTVIPTVIVMIIFDYGWRGYGFMRAVPRNAMEIKVEAKQWSWMFQYANNKKSSTLKIPVDKSIKLLLHSQDIIHSLYIPAFRIKEDVVPGRENFMWFRATEKGTYDILCAEYCGELHSSMLASVEVMEEKKFQDWYNTPPSPEEMAEELIKTCIACHTLDGKPKIGPTFRGIFGRQSLVITEGQERTITVDDAYLKRSMLEPKADLVKGYEPVMVPQNLNEVEIQALIAYLKKLR